MPVVLDSARDGNAAIRPAQGQTSLLDPPWEVLQSRQRVSDTRATKHTTNTIDGVLYDKRQDTTGDGPCQPIPRGGGRNIDHCCANANVEGVEDFRSFPHISLD